VTTEDIPAALFALVCAALFTVLMTIAAGQILQVVRDRPIVLKDRWTGDLQIARSPNPKHRPRRHGVAR
jgi:hypothetical protein